jgi:hypothetical protein
MHLNPVADGIHIPFERHIPAPPRNEKFRNIPGFQFADSASRGQSKSLIFQAKSKNFCARAISPSGDNDTCLAFRMRANFVFVANPTGRVAPRHRQNIDPQSYLTPLPVNLPATPISDVECRLPDQRQRRNPVPFGQIVSDVADRKCLY